MLEQYDEKALADLKAKLQNRSKYPWNVWLDGEVHIIKKGVDFDIVVENMKSTIYGAANRKGMSASIRNLDEDTLYFMATRDTHVIVDTNTNLRAVNSDKLVKAVELGESS